MKILITGATGFIGRRIAEDFLKQGHTVLGTGRNREKGQELVGIGTQFEAGDLCDLGFCKKICEGVDAIVHCAGLAGTWGSYQSYYQANVFSTQNLLKAAQEAGVKRFINISSPSIYFDFCDQYNLKEDQLPKKFSNHYAKTKYEAEKLVEKAHQDGFLTVNLRPRFVIGAGDTNIIPRMIRLQKAGMLKQIGDGKNRVDVTSVANVIEAVRLCFLAPIENMGQTYNISNGQSVRLWDFIDEVLSALGVATERPHVPAAPVMFLAHINEKLCRLFGVKEEPKILPITIAVMKQSMTLDISKAREKLGYQPVQTTAEAIQEFANWWNSQKV